MRRSILLLTILISIAAMARDKYYNNKAEQAALKTAYKIIKVYYPTNDVCASDSVFDIDRFGFAPIDDMDEMDKLYLQRLERRFTYDPPVYCKNVAKVLHTDTCNCSDPQYYAEFSVPYKGYIACYIMPKSRRVGIDYMSKDPHVTSFVFKYDESGDIYEIKKGLTHFD